VRLRRGARVGTDRRASVCRSCARSHRAARPERRRQVHLDQTARRRNRAADGQTHSGTGSRHRYFAQQQLEQLKLTAMRFGICAISAARLRRRRRAKDTRPLGSLAFKAIARSNRSADFPVAKRRADLALLVARRPNLLLLDEPTNHLDIEMRQALSVATAELRGRSGRGLSRSSFDQVSGRYAVAGGGRKIAGIRRRCRRLSAMASIAR